MTNKIALSPAQAGAVRPTVNIIVQANAGTGKTFVLVQRLLRLLFREYAASPHITYLSRRSVAETDHISHITNTRSGILCLTYTNAGAAEMRARILEAILDWARADDDELRELLFDIAHKNPATDEDLSAARRIFYDFIDCPGALKIQTIHSFCEDILRRFSIEAGIPPAWRLVSGPEQKRLLKDAFSEMMNHPASLADTAAFDNILSRMSEHSLDDLLRSLSDRYGSIFLLKQKLNFPGYLIEKTGNFLNVQKAPKKPDFDGDISEILTKTGEIKKRLRPELARIAPEVYEYSQYQRNLAIHGVSADFLRLCGAFADKYIELKRRRAALDFDDMLLKTMGLFSNPAVMGAVLSSLDYDLRHILIDESQDNSPAMWKIIFSMLEDFFTSGERENPRTFFMVGDPKQSIFSFQGADPSEFEEISKKLTGAASAGVRQYETVSLLDSRRAAQAVLNVVDYFFNNARLPRFPEKIAHKSHRVGEFGMVEINPLFLKMEGEDLDSARKRYAQKIADKIAGLIASGAAAPKDIMILLQRRDPFAPMLSGQLKRLGVQTAGNDRIILPDYPAVRDLLNLMRFALDPEYEAALAFVLRGPLFGLTEKELYELCVHRKGSLLDEVRARRPADYEELMRLAAMSDLPPFEFLSNVMNGYREKIIGALGRQVLEPLDEFMTLALSFTRTRPGGLTGFLRWFLDGENEIRRDMEKGAGVRILTAHSSKGLEAPIVFLIDATRNPSSPASHAPFEVMMPEPDVFLCKSPDIEASEKYSAAKDKELARRTEEYWRLLYVAMTRARDRLYVYGCEERNKNDSWHSKLYEIVATMPGAKINGDGVIEISGGTPKISEKSAKDVEVELPGLPPKALKNREKPKTAALSRDFDKNKAAMAHGTDVHRLLQHLNLDAPQAGMEDLAEKIRQNPLARQFWTPGARTEMPLAGTIDGKFYSLRIDRMLETDKEVLFLDYKTDRDRTRRDEYVAQVKTYAALLGRIYPNKPVRGFILWLKDFDIEEILP